MLGPGPGEKRGWGESQATMLAWCARGLRLENSNGPACCLCGGGKSQGHVPCVFGGVSHKAHVPGVWDPSGWAELQTKSPFTELPKTGLENPFTPGHKDCRLIRERGKGIGKGGPLWDCIAGKEWLLRDTQ